MRPLLLLCAFALALCVSGQPHKIDSVHVFKAIPRAAYTSASANALAWRLHQAHAEHVTLKGEDMALVREGIAEYKPVTHVPGPLPELTHLAMLFTNGRPVAMGISEDLDRVINFTARTEYRISTISEHMKVRAVLLELMMRL